MPETLFIKFVLNQNMNGFINGSRLPSNVTNSIIETVKPLDIGIYLLYTQNAVDAPESSNASFTIVNKAGTNNFIFLYNYVYERIYYSSMNSETTELSWTKMNNL